MSIGTPDAIVHSRRLFTIIARDITERRRTEAELRDADRRKDIFLGMLAHELRNPLAPVSNALSVMMLEPLVSPTLRQCRDMIDRQISHLTRLVDDLLDAGRVTTGKVVLRLEPVDMSEVVVRAVETRGEAGRSRIELPLLGRTIEEDFGPSQLRTFVVPADPAQPVREVDLIERPLP